MSEPVKDASLVEAVARMTAKAKSARKEQLVMSPEEWIAWVQPYIINSDFNGFSSEVLQRVGDVDVESLNRWLALTTNIWNNVPQADRGWRSANEIIREQQLKK